MRVLDFIEVLKDFGFRFLGNAVAEVEDGRIVHRIHWSASGKSNAVNVFVDSFNGPARATFSECIDCRGPAQIILFRLLARASSKKAEAGRFTVHYHPTRNGCKFGRILRVFDFDYFLGVTVLHPEAVSLAEGWFRGDHPGVLIDWLEEHDYIPHEAL